LSDKKSLSDIVQLLFSESFVNTMWLINTETLALEYFHEPDRVRYVILSHTWEEDEMTFQEMQLNPDLEKKGFKKILDCCKWARQDDFQYAWVDTCWSGSLII
jgi:hypothetical protein